MGIWLFVEEKEVVVVEEEQELKKEKLVKHTVYTQN